MPRRCYFSLGPSVGGRFVFATALTLVAASSERAVAQPPTGESAIPTVPAEGTLVKTTPAPASPSAAAGTTQRPTATKSEGASIQADLAPAASVALAQAPTESATKARSTRSRSSTRSDATLPEVILQTQRLADRTRLTIRSTEATLPKVQIQQARTGMLLTIAGHKFRPYDLELSSPRVTTYEMSNSGGKAALRLRQTPEAKSSLRSFIRTERSDTAMVVDILDGELQAPGAVLAPAPTADATRQALSQLLDGKQPAVNPPAPSDAAAAAGTDDVASAADASPVSQGAVLAGAGPSDLPMPEPDAQAAAAPTAPAMPSMWPTFLATAIIAALGAGVTWWAKRGGQISLKRARSIEVLERATLGPRHSVVRVRIEGRELVLGLTEGAFQLLSESGESTLPGPVLAPKRQASADYNAVHAPTTASDPDTQKKLRMFKQRLAQALREESGPGERATGPSGTIVAGGQDRESWSEREIA